MKVSVLQENFKKALEDVGPFIPKNALLPIVAGYKLETDGGRLTITGTDLECAITTWCEGKIEEEGSVIVAKGLLLDTVKALPKERIDLSLDGKTLVLDCAGRSMRLATLGEVEDYPPIPAFNDQEPTFSLFPDQLDEVIRMVVHCAATDGQRPVLTGVHVSAKDGTLKFAAADGFRLGVYSMEGVLDHAANWSFIIPANTLVKVRRLLKKETNQVHFTLNSKNTQVEIRASYEVVSQVITGTYPNYNMLIPKNSTTRIEVLRDDLLRAAKAADVYARNGAGIVRLQASHDTTTDLVWLTVSARAEEVGDYEERLLAVLKGDENKIAINARYLLDVLSALQGDVVVMEMTGLSVPMMWGDRDYNRYIEMIMPIFVQW